MKAFDLSMPINEKTPVYPGDPKPEFRQAATIRKNGWNEKRIAINTHFGTHIDAPFHMLEKGKKLSDFQIESFFGEAIVIDGKNPDIAAVKKGDIVFLFTGHTQKMKSPDFFKNNPVVSRETAELLIKRKARMVGIDSYTVDNEPFETHKLLMENNVLIVENLVNLGGLLNKRFQCYVLPLNLDKGDGAPCRVIGII